MHCFSGDADFARRCLDRGAHLSFAGTVTFKNAQPLRDALVVTPRDRVLVETDAPFLTPTPYRGRPNASYLVPLTMRAMAEVRGDDLGRAVRGRRREHGNRLRRTLVVRLSDDSRRREPDHFCRLSGVGELAPPEAVVMVL